MEAEELTVERFAEVALYKEQTVRQKISEGKLPVKRYGRRVRVLRTQDVEKLINERRALAATAA